MKIIKNYIYNSAYQIFLIIVPLVTIPYISRVLGPDLIGVNSYTNTIIGYFVLLANLGVSVYGNRAIAYSRDSIEERSKKFWEIIILKMLLGIAVSIICGIFIIFYPLYKLILVVQSIQIIATIVDISWLFTGMEDFRRMVIRNFVVKLLSILSIFIFVKTKEDFILYVFIVAVSMLIGNLSLWKYAKNYVQLVDFNNLDIILHFIPILTLFLPQIMSTLFMSINKILLGNFSTMVQAGFFDNSDKLIRVLLAFITSIGTVIFPKLANEFKKNNMDKVKELLSISFDAVNIITVPIVAGIIGVSSLFSEIFFGSEFQGIDIVLSVLSIQLIFMGYSSVIGSQYLVATDKTRELTYSVVIGVIVIIITSLVLVPTYGAVGSSISSVLGECAIALSQLFYVRREIDLYSLLGDIPKYIVSSTIMLISIMLCRFLPISFIPLLFIQVLCGVLVYVVCIYLLKPRLISKGLMLLKTKN